MNAPHHHPRSVALLLALVVALSGLVTAAPAGAAGLDERLALAVRSSPVRARTSVYAWDQQSRQVLYSRDAARPVSPASTMKLLTGAAALARFGPEHRFSTRVAVDGYQVGTTWFGDVWLIGGGDPSLSTAGFARDNFRGQGANIGLLVGPLRQMGIRTVAGRLRVDDSMLDEMRWVPEWKPAFRFVETGALGALTVNQALTGRYVGSSSSRAPDIHAGEIYRGLLGRAGIRVTGATKPGTMGEGSEIIGTISSPPLSILLRHMDQQSDNFYAEIILKNIGADQFEPAVGGASTVDGRRAAQAELARIGIDMSSVNWVDGSGLAYGNRLSARTLGHVLGVGAQATWGELWIGTFARSGVSGTLRRRMTRLPYRGRVFAKTGTLRHASGLAGFSQRVGSNRRYGLVVLTYDPSGRQLAYTSTRSLQDKVAMVLVR